MEFDGKTIDDILKGQQVNETLPNEEPSVITNDQIAALLLKLEQQLDDQARQNLNISYKQNKDLLKETKKEVFNEALFWTIFFNK